ncbi:RagB/SusD family nutrient uptake outer membrane protein [Sphingobacterium litopenaei]|uniref:RagB/SusD family nutrient uptake outer membrane protein n=1 Tax=Sphingobacterium litopenaei TaxID=2763500 RepID=A0ABR7YAP7_9SPHI|nr:RagB/SusD family nutrient uptake outer membrane protein [Sphingobacterium litopenaei]MBD1428376.1 RagB/SusD family nutrient uptake outer membrane protein [Sphingobacterium litopenaei]
MKKIVALSKAFISSVILMMSCTKDLDQFPTIETTSENVYTSLEGYKSVMAKLYGSFAVAGNNRGDGDADMASSTASWGYLRVYFNMQEVPTDELIYSWAGGDNMVDLQFMSWGASDTWVSAMYYRIYYSIALANEFLRNAGDDKIAGFSDSEKSEIQSFKAEARFLRALAYTHAMDLYGNVPFVQETDPVSAFFPQRITRSDLFDFIEKELVAISDILPAPKQNQYGRVSRGASWALLAKNYLNAEIYTGKARYNDCVTYSKKVIDAGYTLESDYKKLFNADNDKRTNEIIFAIQADVERTNSWGATTYLVNGPIVGSMKAADYGVLSGWNSFRTLREFVKLFEANDQRGRFWKDGQSLDVDDPSTISQGYGVIKFTNLYDNGTSKTDEGMVNTDFPMIRLADVYLTYAEGTLRNGGGNLNEALALVNSLRQRAYGNASGNISTAQLNLDFILAERGRELFWEATRRTDLIRFGKFTTNAYLWQWKGGSVDGVAVDSKYNLYPIPTTDLSANPNLIPTTGY